MLQLMVEWLREHWCAFWRSAAENLYTFIWWAIFTAIIDLVLIAGSWILARAVPMSYAIARFAATWEERFLSGFVALLLAILATGITLALRRHRTVQLPLYATSTAKADLTAVKIPAQVEGQVAVASYNNWLRILLMIGIILSVAFTGIVVGEHFAPSPPLNPISASVTIVKPSPSAQPNKYICLSTVTPADGKGKYGLVVEFGMTGDAISNGVTASVHVGALYSVVRFWVSSPLRTDQDGGGVFMNISQRRQPPVFSVTFSNPSLNAHQSLYMFFEADSPMEVKGFEFVEDWLAVQNQERFTQLTHEPFAACPRG
jgi:hypothetical protein